MIVGQMVGGENSPMEAKGPITMAYSLGRKYKLVNFGAGKRSASPDW